VVTKLSDKHGLEVYIAQRAMQLQITYID